MKFDDQKLARRDFLKCAAQGVALACMGTPLVACGGEPAGITIGTRRATVIDIHGHCGIKAVEDVVRGTSLERTIAPIRLLAPKRLEQMDARRIDTQVLSINQYWWYEADEQLATDVVRAHDDGLSAWCSEHGDRFIALTSVALQHPELAAAQLERAVTELGFRGASIGGHVNGLVPTDEQYDVFWAKAESLGVPVFVHPTGAANVLKDGSLGGRGDLVNIIGNPLETTVFLSRMIFDGALDRFPELKICAAHGGGYLPSYLGRTEVTCDVRRDADCANQRRPSEYLRDQIFVDSMVFSNEGLRHLCAEMGPDRVVYGTDLPFSWPDTLDLIVSADFLSDDDKIALLGGNLKKLLNID